MSGPQKLRLTLESTLDSVEAAELIVQRMAELNGFDADQVHQIGMGVRESMANAVKHGNCFDADKAVSFCASVTESGLEVTVADEGCGFDPCTVRNPLDDENLLLSSGRGLLMMRAFFDEVRVAPRADSGTEVCLVKYRTPGAGGTTQEEVR